MRPIILTGSATCPGTSGATVVTQAVPDGCFAFVTAVYLADITNATSGPLEFGIRDGSAYIPVAVDASAKSAGESLVFRGSLLLQPGQCLYGTLSSSSAGDVLRLVAPCILICTDEGTL